MLKFPALLFLQELFLGSLLGCLAPSTRCVEKKSSRERVIESRGGCALILQQLEVGGVQQSPIPSHHGWWALPVSILAGTCWHSQLEVRVIPSGIVIPPCVGVLALILAIQTTACVFFLGLLPLQGTTGISWAVIGFGDSHSHSCSFPNTPVCLKLGGMSVQETPKPSR